MSTAVTAGAAATVPVWFPRPGNWEGKAGRRGGAGDDVEVDVRRETLASLLELIRPVGRTVAAHERLVSVHDVHAAARRRLPRMIADFVDGGADDEVTTRNNVADFASVALNARMLVDVSSLDISTTVVGQRLELPVVLSPVGLVGLAHPEGELAAARAAGAAGTVFTISTASTYSIEDIAAVATGPLWFQLYLWRSRSTVESLVERSQAAGCTALVLTVDTPALGNRERDLRNGMSIPPRVTVRNALDVARHPRWVRGLVQGPPMGFGNLARESASRDVVSHSEFINRETDPSVTWDNLRWLRDNISVPLLVKGIVTPEDARRAVDAGADAVVVSNHGGRQLDSLPSAVSRCARIADAVSGQADVMLDGGVRRGTDVVKAVALGASAVMMGRPWAWGLAVGGEAGVRHVLGILERETRRALTLVGVSSLAELDRSVVEIPPTWR